MKNNLKNFADLFLKALFLRTLPTQGSLYGHQTAGWQHTRDVVKQESYFSRMGFRNRENFKKLESSQLHERSPLRGQQSNEVGSNWRCGRAVWSGLLVIGSALYFEM
jgi:hypothetical protein